MLSVSSSSSSTTGAGRFLAGRTSSSSSSSTGAGFFLGGIPFCTGPLPSRLPPRPSENPRAAPPPPPRPPLPRRFRGTTMSNGKASTYIDPEDMFKDTRMSFGDHLEDLRTHLWRAIKGFIIAMVFALFIGKYAVQFITAPVEEQLHRFYDRTSKERYKEVLAAAQKEGVYSPSKRFKVA